MFSNLNLDNDPSTFRHPSHHLADEVLVIWKNNYNRKAKTDDYLGLSSDPSCSFRKVESENCREGEVLCLRVLMRAREVSTMCMGRQGIWEQPRG
jgi:hypothetical protein